MSCLYYLSYLFSCVTYFNKAVEFPALKKSVDVPSQIFNIIQTSLKAGNISFKTSFRFQARLYSRLNMPEWYPVSGDAFNIIQPCKNLIVRLPSENYKNIDLKPKSYYPSLIQLTCRIINLGKFGSFSADQLIGKPFGPSWEILPTKEIKLLERETQEEEGMLYCHLN